jgi:hypothetical protein
LKEFQTPDFVIDVENRSLHLSYLPA